MKKNTCHRELTFLDSYFEADTSNYHLDVNELGIEWINGSCSERFKELKNLERMILKLYYIDGYTDREIGNLYGYHINTIFNKRKKSIEILKK